MKYIGQIFTGGWHQKNYTSDEIIHRLAEITEAVPLEKVIIGWHIDPELYRKTGAWLHEHGMKMLLWLPVFSETGEMKEADNALDLYRQKIGNLALQEGENFAFYCPSSQRNIQNVFDLYDECFSGCGFDGIFLDKIRGQSFVAGKEGILSCCCEKCEQVYEEHGFSLPRFRKLYEEKGDRLFASRGYQKQKGFLYAEKETEDYFRIKEEIIAASVNRIARHFKEKGLEVGLDLYAPLLSRTVGQNYRLLAEEADFIKPMMYRKTEAPAGIGYEYETMRKALKDSRGYEDLRFDAAFLKGQLDEFRDLPVGKYPGIEVNYRKDIARTDPAYIRESLEVFRSCGMEGAVLAWDLMLAPDSHLEVFRDAE